MFQVKLELASIKSELWTCCFSRMVEVTCANRCNKRCLNRVPRFGIRGRINFNDCRSEARRSARANPIGKAATNVLFRIKLRSNRSDALLGNPEIMEEFQADLFSVVGLYSTCRHPVFGVKKYKGCCAGRSLKWNLIMKTSGVLITIAKPISILDCGPAPQFEL